MDGLSDTAEPELQMSQIGVRAQKRHSGEQEPTREIFQKGRESGVKNTSWEPEVASKRCI